MIIDTIKLKERIAKKMVNRIDRNIVDAEIIAGIEQLELLYSRVFDANFGKSTAAKRNIGAKPHTCGR